MNSMKKLLVAALVVLGIAGCATGKENSSQTTSATAESKKLQVTSFDPVFAQSTGMNVQFYHYLLMFLLALVAITAMQSVGTVMIVALLITPAATAYLYSNRLKIMLILAAIFGSLSSILGLFIGYTFNIAIGSTIVLTAAALFVVSFIISPKQRERRKSHE